MRFHRIRWAVGLVCLLLATRASADGYDFRKVRWGMSRYDVMASEENAPRRMKQDQILYQVSLFNRPAYLMYRLYDERLVGARYVLPIKAADTLDKLTALVSMRYGASPSATVAAGETRVWTLAGRTVRLYIPRKGQAVIDVASAGEAEIPAKEVALLRQSTLENVSAHL